MRTRDAVLQYQEVLSDAGTKTIDLDLVDPVSALYLEHEAVNGATSNLEAFIPDVITKVEIVDGSEVLYSVNMSQLEALHVYKTKRPPVLFPSEWADGTQRHGVLLMFGRHLWDREFAMDFKRFKNPQLKITSNLAAIRAVGATGFVTATLKSTVVAKVMEDAGIVPNKYLMAKELEAFTAATSGDKRIQLPTDHIYRMLMLRLWLEGSDINEVITDAKLTMDTDKFIAFNRKVQQLDAEALAEFGEFQYKHDTYQASGAIIRILPNKEPRVQPRLWSNSIGRMMNVINIWSSQFTLGMFSDATTADATARQVTNEVAGHAIHATLPIPLGIMDQPDTWLNPTPYTKMELVLTQAAAGVCQIVAEQVRPL